MELHYAKVTSKGQITLPVEIRERLAAQPGATILFKVMRDGRVVVSHPAQDIEAFFGSVTLPAGSAIKEIAELTDAINTAEAVARYRRSLGEDVQAEDVIELPVAAG